MADDTAVIFGLVQELARRGDVTPDPVHEAEGVGSDLVQVHVSWESHELDGGLIRTWRDPTDNRVHLMVRWKP